MYDRFFAQNYIVGALSICYSLCKHLICSCCCFNRVTFDVMCFALILSSSVRSIYHGNSLRVRIDEHVFSLNSNMPSTNHKPQLVAHSSLHIMFYTCAQPTHCDCAYKIYHFLFTFIFRLSSFW